MEDLPSVGLVWQRPGSLAHVNPLLKFPAGRRATASIAARQVRMRRLILVIRATGAPQNRLPRTAVNVLVPAGLCRRLGCAAARAGDSAPGQTVRVSRIGSPSCLRNAAATRPCRPFYELALVRAGRNPARGRLDEAAAHLAVAETHAETAPAV
jgi:hypothetical protein